MSTNTIELNQLNNEIKPIKHKPMLLIVVSLLSVIFISVLTLLFSRLLIKNLGDDYNGLYRWIANIVTFLTIAESGIGAGIIQKSFKYFKNMEYDKISHLFSASRKLFIVLGFIYLLLVAIFAPIMGLIIKPNQTFTYEKIVMVTCILALKLLPRYFYAGNQRIILLTTGNGVWMRLTEVMVSAILFIPMIFYLIYGKSGFGMFINIMIFIVISEILSAVLLFFISKKVITFFEMNWKISIRSEIQISALLFPLIIRGGELILLNTDEIILGGNSHNISTDHALLLVSVYSSYLVFSNLTTMVLNGVFGSLIFSIGNKTAGDFSDVNNKKLKKAIWATLIVSFGMFMIVSLTSPFVVNYIFNANAKTEYFSPDIALLFGVSVLLTSFKLLPIMIYKLRGKWKKYASLVLVELLVNIILSLILIHYMGIIGLLMATCISQGLTIPVYTIQYFKLFNKISYKTQVWKIFINTLFFIILGIMINIFYFPKVMNNSTLSVITEVLIYGSITMLLILIQALINEKIFKVNFLGVKEKVKNGKQKNKWNK